MIFPNSRRPVQLTLFALTVVQLTACDGHAPRPLWVEVFRDNDYRVSVDTLNVERRSDRTFGVRYETWHLHGEFDGGVRYNREEVQSELRCAPLEFRTIEVTLFLNYGPPVRRRAGDGAGPDAPWRRPEVSSVDIDVMRAACRLLLRSS